MLSKYQIGDIINSQYEVQKIFTGGMGLVYACYDKNENRLIALKTLQDHLLTNYTGLDRFVNEAQTWIQLGAYKHIVRAYSIERIEGIPYIILEYVGGNPNYGNSLRGWVLHKSINLELTLDIMIQTCLGLSYSQTKVPGIVHRDLKPENILLTNSGIAKITDFGLAKTFETEDHFFKNLPEDESQELFHTTITRSGHIVGTPPYMSPEQCRGEDINFRSDIYSIGCILFEMVTGQRLIKSNSPSDWIKFHLTETPTRPSKVVSDVPKHLEQIILRCLNKIPDHRYSNYAVLTKELIDVYKYITAKEYYALQEEKLAFNPKETFEKAKTFDFLGKTHLALKELNILLEKDPHFISGWILKGAIFIKLKRHGEALLSLEKAIDLDPNSARAYINKALVFLDMGNLQESRRLLTLALEIDPSSGAAWINLGIVFEAMNQPVQALECYDKALTIDPWSRELWSNRGRILNDLGRKDEGDASYKNALIYSTTHEERATAAITLSISQVGSTLFKDEELYNLALRSIERFPLKVNPFSKVVTESNPIFELAFGKGSTKHIIENTSWRVLIQRSFIKLSQSYFSIKVHKDISASTKLTNEFQEYLDDWRLKNTSKDAEEFASNIQILAGIFLSSHLLEVGEYEMATKVMQRVVVQKSENDKLTVVAWGLYGMVLYMSGDLSNAIIWLNRFLINLPNEEMDIFEIKPEVLAICGHILMRQNNFDDVIE